MPLQVTTAGKAEAAHGVSGEERVEAIVAGEGGVVEKRVFGAGAQFQGDSGDEETGEGTDSELEFVAHQNWK